MRRVPGLLMLGGLIVAALLSGCASLTTPQANAQSGPSYPVIRVPADNTPTVAPLGYTLGAWVSDMSPPQGSPITLYASVRDAGTPVAGAVVTITVQYPGGARSYGPTKTPSDGLAVFSLSTAGVAVNQPVMINVSATYQGQTLAAWTNFTPAP